MMSRYVDRNNLDIVGISGLSIEASHGLLEHERYEVHPFVTDVKAYILTHIAGQTDNMMHSISYADIADDIHAVVAGPRVQLIETLAENIAERVLNRGALYVDVTVHKPEAPLEYTFADAYVHIQRTSFLAEPPSGERKAVLALGGNIGDTREIFLRALDDIRELPETKIFNVAPFVTTSPVLAEGQKPQADYLNTVIEIDTRLSPFELLHSCWGIEKKYHRERTERWGARTLDIDIIDYEGVSSDVPSLTLPHPRAHERAFVLEPWCSINEYASLDGQSIKQLLHDIRHFS
ncbi:MAG: 2-amino-4-hydroxy-6-hydroxymethyldihydropteridine diphosphokinase [Actinomycetaceae bacterium]|nr:2-amino-4-hydroxy-6-hydroxymethyldihydropteridine diphosphokinase [Actinomycetaceae bacterium]